MKTVVTTERALPVLCPHGGMVFCLATGPSLTQSDVDLCRGKGVVVAVNDAHRLAPWADVLYSSDRYWWVYHRGVPSFMGLKVGIEPSPGRGRPSDLVPYPDIVVMRHTGVQGVETDPNGLRTCGNNSGGAAVNLAVHLGASRIVLLGYDMNDSRGRHFFGDHPPCLSNSHHFPVWLEAFRLMREPIERLGIEVINCSRSTSLDAFDCVSLEDVLCLS